MSFIAGDIMIRMAADVASLRRDMDTAKSTVGTAVDVMKKAAIGLAGAFSAQMFAGWLKSAIDAADEMNKLSQRTGIAVEEISGLQLAFQLGGAESGVFASSMSKLSKQVVEGNQTFRQLGIETRNADGTVKSLKQVLYDTADAFAGMENGTAKSNLAVELFGKSGAELIPILNSGSEGLREMDEMARKLGLTMDADTAASAEKFNDTVDLLGMGLQGIGRQVVSQLLPTLTSLAGTFLETMTSGDTLRKVADGLAATLKLLYSAGLLVVEAFSTVGKTIGAAAAQVMAVMSGDFKGAMNIGKEYAADIQTSWGNTAKNLETVWSDSGGKTVEAMVGVQGALRQLTPATKEQEEAQKKAAEEAKKHAAELDKLAQTLKLEQAGLSGDYLTKLQQLNELRTTGRISTEEYDRAVQSLIAKQPVIKAATEEAQKAQDELNKTYAAAAAATTKYELAQIAETEAMRESVVKLREQNETAGLNERQLVAREAAVLRNRAADLEWQSGMEGGNYQLTEQARLLRERADLLEQGVAAKEARAAADEWKKTTDNIQNGLTDALMRGFENGKGFAENLKDYIKNAFKTLVADFIVRPIMAPISQGVGSFMQSLTGGGGGIGGGLSNLLSNGMDFLTGGTMSGMGLSLVNSSLGQSLGLSSTQMIGGNAIVGPTALGSNIAAGLGMAGNAFAGYGISKALSGGYSTGGNTVNVLSGIASAFLGPIAGVVGGIINRAFGRKPKEITESGIEGSFAAGDATGRTYAEWRRKGGWFRSTKYGTDYGAMSEEINAALDMGAMQVYDKTRAYAEALGLPAQQLADVTTNFKVKLTGKAEEDETAIAQALDSYQQALADKFKSALEPFRQAGEELTDTMGRLAALQQLSDSLNQFGGIFSRVASASIEARENIIGLAGGIEQLMQKAGQFVRDYYTQEEQAGLQARGVLQVLESLGISGGDLGNRQEFRALVESLDVSTEQGQEQLVALLELAPQFAQLADYAAQQGLTLEEIAAQAPVVSLLDKMLPEQISTTEAVSDVAARITEGNATLERIVQSIQSGNVSIASGLQALAAAQETIAALQQQANAIAASTAKSVGEMAGTTALADSAPTYNYDLGRESTGA